jgi:hypothetical protein
MIWRWIDSEGRNLGKQRWLRSILSLTFGLGVALYVGLFLWHNWQKVLEEDVVVNPGYLLNAFALFGLNFMLFILAWQGIVRRFGGVADWKQNARLYSQTYIARMLPTPTWFLISRVYLYHQTGMQKRVILVMTALETFLHMLAGLVIYGLFSLDLQQPITLLYLLVLAPIVLFFLKPAWLQLSVMSGVCPEPGIRRRDLALWLGLYLLSWMIAGPFLASVIRAFSKAPPLPIGDLWRVWSLSGVVSYLSEYVLGGVGILREFTLGWSLQSFYPLSITILVTLGSRLVLTISGLFWGMIVLIGVRCLSWFERRFTKSELIKEIP